MSNKLVFSLLFFGVLTAGRVAAQGADLAPRVKAQAQKMGTALTSGDYAGFAHFMNPAVIKMIGGEGAMAKQLQALSTNMKQQGASFGKIVIGNPSKILPAGKELQCTIPQESEIVAQGGSIVTKSTLIAISADGGKNWTFLDTVNKNLAQVRQLLPNLNSAITFPPSQQVRK